MQLRLRANRGDVEMSIQDEVPSNVDDSRGDSNNSDKSWGSKLLEILIGALEIGVQIFINYWESLKSKEENLWVSDQWEEIVDEGANKVKLSFALAVDNAADQCKKHIQKLPEGQRMKAARLFASAIDLVTKFQTTVGENFTILKDYIGDFLESAGPMLKDIMTHIKGTADEIMKAIRSIFNSGSASEMDGIPLLPR
jgi:hypothetical protein